MKEDQRYVSDSLRTSGIGFIVAGVVGLFFGKAPTLACMFVIGIGIAMLASGYYYVKRRISHERV